jgi:hypothetical protein
MAITINKSSTFLLFELLLAKFVVYLGFLSNYISIFGVVSKVFHKNCTFRPTFLSNFHNHHH